MRLNRFYTQNEAKNVENKQEAIDFIKKELKAKKMSQREVRSSLDKKFKDDKSNISISISTEQTESLNKKALRMLLNDEQYNQVVTKNSFKKLLIITPKDRERLKNYGKK